MPMDTLQAFELFAGVVLVLVTVLLFRHLRLLDAPGTSSPSPPRPRGLPLIGNLHQLGRLPHASLAALAAKHAAPLMLLRLGSVPTLVVSTADAARALFQPNDRALSGRPVQRASTRLSYGLQDMTFSAPDSPLWRAARRACLSELLGAPRVRGFRDAREAEAAALIADVAEHASSAAGSQAVNLSEKLTSASNRIVMRVAFGDYGEETAAVLEESQKHFGAFFVSDYLPWLGWVDALRGLRRGLERYFHELDAFYERLIHDHLSKQAGSKEEDLVDVLLRLHQDPAHRSTFGNRGAVKGILMDIFLAGTETSAAALEWTMTELIKHPDILRKAQSEVRSAVDGGKDMVREADLPRLRYLKSVIRESLRLHPPAPLLVPRETTEACTVRGHEIPAGTRVIVNAKAIGTDAGAWGPDAARFVPERHLAEGVDLSDHKPWHDGGFALVPFGMGRRSCPGVHFATAVVELLLANLLFCFDWRAPLGEVDVEEKPGLIVSRNNPLVLVPERRCVK
ncbi:hypothetical protein BDA96_06G134200 [Sorghum bicolor]|uniref:Cytochrome P450 n=1 Tax=Sorghum bicolor TaxID=4558 RepID=A0A921UBU3_SORBI|nr:hypothetical protein BDA96_06G134200 [Sorghum bicolor]